MAETALALLFAAFLASPDNPADLDADGDVDATDFATFSACVNGSNNPPKPACTNLGADLDADGDVDGFDFLSFTTVGRMSSLPVRSADGSGTAISFDIGTISLLLSSMDDNGPNDANPSIGVIQYKIAPTTIPVTVKFFATTSGLTDNYGVFGIVATLSGTALGDNSTKTMTLDPTFKKAMGVSSSSLWTGPQGLGFDVLPDEGTGGIGEITGFGAFQTVGAMNVDFGNLDAKYAGHPAGSHTTVAHDSRSGVASPLLLPSEQYVAAVGPVTMATGSLVPPAMTRGVAYEIRLTGVGSLYDFQNDEYTIDYYNATGSSLVILADQSPVIADIPDHYTAPGVPYGLTPTLTQGVAPVTWSLITGPSGMTVDASTGAVGWADPQPAGSSHMVEIRAANSVGSDDETWTLTINITDCNGNGIGDDKDISTDTSEDCNGNLVPDECDMQNGTSTDCNANLVPDECDLQDGTSADCNGNLVPDECDTQDGTSKDCNANLVPDECDMQNGTSTDCNANLVPDECDVRNGESKDCNGNVVPDECERDCNDNGMPDNCDLSSGTSTDCNGNGIPDDCDAANGTLKDEDGNDVPDACEAILEVKTIGEGRISRSPAKSRYVPGEMVELKAEPADRWRFVGWSGDTTAYTSVISVYMRPVTRLTATFENPSPIPISGDTYHAVVGAGVQFDGSGCRDPLGEALTLTWNFGDGTTGEGLTPTHAYARAGYYVVILTVRDTGGNTASSRLTAIISEPIPTPPDDDPSDSTNDADSQTPSTPAAPAGCFAIDYLTLTMLLGGLTLMRLRPQLA